MNEDPTHNRLLNLQKYLLKLHNSGELNKEDYIKIRPKNAKPGRAHGVPKIHKHYVNIPKLRPIVDTVGSTHYSVGQYLTNLLNPLTHNESTLKDYFDAAGKIKNIPNNLFDDSYVFVSFDVESLFTNVPLKGTIDIILKRVYQDNNKHQKAKLEEISTRLLYQDFFHVQRQIL